MSSLIFKRLHLLLVKSLELLCSPKTEQSPPSTFLKLLTSHVLRIVLVYLSLGKNRTKSELY
jgi:hypothetical protein